MAVVGPEAAEVEAGDIVEPVGVARQPRRLPVWRRAPVVRPVWGAAADRVSRQHQSPGAVVATLLP